MTMHYSVVAELARQRQQQIARDVEACRTRTSSRRRWWEPGFLHHATVARDGRPATPRRVLAPA
ncbi:MAG TPA: hypothetical protein VH395_00900 [Jatrophihabitantaceae bacterium]|jgi:hypothetical protein